MQKKLIALAVAGLVSGGAFAQTTVTISGFLKVSADNVSYSGASTLPTGTTAGGGLGREGNKSETRVADNSSRIILSASEDLGSGLKAVGQVDLRINPATSAAPASNGLGAITAGGNTWVGLQSASLGRLTMGRWDLHYGKSGDNWNPAGAGSLQAWGSALFDSIGAPAAATAALPATTGHQGLANQSRTNQVIRWDMPTFNGFDMIIAYSANPLCAAGGGACTAGDLGGNTIGTAAGTSIASGVIGTGPQAGQAITRKGSGWNFNPKFNTKSWGVEYSYWNAKADPTTAGITWALVPTTGTAAIAATLIPDDQRSDVFAGWALVGPVKVGLAWNHSKRTSVASGLVTGDRTSLAIPVSYTVGPHMIGYNHVRNSNSKDITTTTGATISGANTGASMNTLTYEYNFSKRTALGATYSAIANKSAAAYSFFYNSPTAFGGNNGGSLPGEKNRLVAGTIMHRF